MNRNVQPPKDSETLDFFRRVDNLYLITPEKNYLAIRAFADFEFVVLEENEYLLREKKK